MTGYLGAGFFTALMLFAPLSGLFGVETAETGSLKETRVVVTRFNNSTGSDRYDSLSDGLVWLVGGDLAKVEGFAVVEREELAKVIAEYKLQATGLVNAESRSILGKFLNAELIVTGGFSLANGHLRIDIRAVEVTSARIVATASAAGPKGKLVDTEKKAINALVGKLIESDNGVVKLTVDDTPEQTLHYIRGLGHYYENQYEAAIGEFMILARGKDHSELGRYWIARGYRELGDWDHCVIECRRYLREFGEEPHADEIRGILEECGKGNKKQ